MDKNRELKVWFDSMGENGKIEHWGMSSALGGTTADLPTNVPQGSDCFDYSTKKVYFFDGVSWK